MEKCPITEENFPTFSYMNNEIKSCMISPFSSSEYRSWIDNKKSLFGKDAIFQGSEWKSHLQFFENKKDDEEEDEEDEEKFMITTIFQKKITICNSVQEGDEICCPLFKENTAVCRNIINENNFLFEVETDDKSESLFIVKEDKQMQIEQVIDYVEEYGEC